jgi:hypothetical protein
LFQFGPTNNYETGNKQQEYWIEFINKYYNYDKIKDKNLINYDNIFLKQLLINQNDPEFISLHFDKISSTKGHALNIVLVEFIKAFRSRYKVDSGVLWLSDKDSVLDIKYFINNLIKAIFQKWSKTLIDTEYCKNIVTNKIKNILLNDLYTHLIEIYRCNLIF